MPEQTTKSIIVKAPMAEVYNLWANIENFPRFMQHVKSVTRTGEHTSHWIVGGPLGKTIAWDAVTTRLDENKRIAWSHASGDIKTSGQVTFAELPQGETQVTVTLQYVPTAGPAGSLVAELFGNVDEKLARDLHSFKRYCEQSARPAQPRA